MNPDSTGKPPLALIAGPTASGKSALALALAEKTGGVVINADSAQVYRDLRIVTARPSAEEEARVEHRLYGYRDAAEICSSADWADDAKAAIADAHKQGRLPILVGGTGLYIRTLLDGIAPVPAIDADVRETVRALEQAESFAALLREDPEAAARIMSGDKVRTARALEVVLSTGQPLKAWQMEKIGGIREEVALAPLILLPPRPWLHARCDARFEAMFSDEAIEEVRALIARPLPVMAPVLRAIGIKEIGAFLNGEMSREQALAAGKIATRQYAKRQYTWFRRQPPLEWPRFEAALDCGEMPDALALLSGGD